MTNLVLETNGSRPRLLEQTLRTLQQNTPQDQYNLTVICDGDIGLFGVGRDGMETTLTINPAIHITGRLKNLGAYWSERQFGRGEWICFIDDDIAVQAGWLERMTWMLYHNSAVKMLGGNRHPYHGINGQYAMSDPIDNNRTNLIEVTDAVAGYCMLMSWRTWDRYSPFDAHAQGISQSEDFQFARRIVEDGGKVGYISPSVLEHCGLTNSVGGKATGADKIKQRDGILYL